MNYPSDLTIKSAGDGRDIELELEFRIGAIAGMGEVVLKWNLTMKSINPKRGIRAEI